MQSLVKTSSLMLSDRSAWTDLLLDDGSRSETFHDTAQALTQAGQLVARVASNPAAEKEATLADKNIRK